MPFTSLDQATLRNPKLTDDASSRWYSYYAGYSADFVEDVLATVGAGPDSLVLDPWNGTGTTTAVASRLGIRSAGFDINPALVIVAKARQLPTSVRGSLEPLAHEVCTLASSIRRDLSIESADLLRLWFRKPAARSVRALELAIRRVFVGESDSTIPVDADDISVLAAFYYCALFDVARDLTGIFRSSNPTWIRRNLDEAEKQEVSAADLRALFRRKVTDLAGRLEFDDDVVTPVIVTGSALNVPATIGRPNVVVGSPPYCTRIDYVVSSLPELAVIGWSGDQVEELRDATLGTPTMYVTRPIEDERWGRTAVTFLREVQAHHSKASQSYYAKYFSQYFSGLYDSLVSLQTACQRDCVYALVVQDSYYKDVRLDLAGVVCEIGHDLSLHAAQVDFRSNRNKAAMHPGARAYRSSFAAVESLIVLSARRDAKCN